ncbi:PspA/IM30 family protein [Pseudomonas taetrolens]|uniref:PspA/IM30 family protein n=1 Tax=Pseudomonas TaxID=286 RepID=UPI001C4F50C4|nr:PspA/IM30 family protein [Pseudomonas sp. D1HM]MBW0236990.1 phage shock protein A [Pseudomonas sp. D1HM]
MNIWSKLLTALRGGANEVGETIVDSQALRILDQEIREAGSELQTSKEALAGLMAKHMLANVNVTDTQSTIHEHEQHVIKALAAGDESLATEVAHRIAALETELPVKQNQAANLGSSVAQLRKVVTRAQEHLTHLTQQVELVKATESVQQAQLAVSKRTGNSQSSLQAALQSLARLKQQQAEREALIEATTQLADEEAVDDVLEAKLKAAGIVTTQPSASSVLARLREKSLRCT